MQKRTKASFATGAATIALATSILAMPSTAHSSPPYLEIKASKAKVAKGKSVEIKGKLYYAGTGKRKVNLQVKAGGKWKTIAKKKTAKKGAYTFTIKPQLASNKYRNVISKAGKKPRVQSGTVTVKTIKPAATTNKNTLTGADIRSARKTMLADHNKIRAGKGLSPYKLDSRLNKVAQDWTNTMAKERRLYHNGHFYEQYPGDLRILSSESVARGQRPTTVTAAWNASVLHRISIIDPYTHVGFGIQRDTYGTYYFTANYGAES